MDLVFGVIDAQNQYDRQQEGVKSNLKERPTIDSRYAQYTIDVVFGGSTVEKKLNGGNANSADTVS